MAVGWPTKTTYANGDVYSASDVNDTNGTLNLLGSSVAYTAGKNILLNGAFQVWQRGTSSTGNAYLADRWYCARLSGTGTFAQETTIIPAGSHYAEKFTASATAQPALYQAIETLNATRYAGQTLTVSAKVAASTSVGFTADVQWSASTDNGVDGTWTSITATSGGTATATSTTYVSLSGVYAVPSTAKSIRVRLLTTSTIANGVVVYFAQAQLEQGLTVTAFQTATGNMQAEVAACQRYFQAYDIGSNQRAPGTGLVNLTTEANIIVKYFCPMRTAPTLSTAGTVGNMRVFDGTSIGTVTAVSISVADTNAVRLSWTTSGIGISRPAEVYQSAAATFSLFLSSEL